MSLLTSQPGWVHELPRQPLVALLLAGGFQAKNASDEAVLEQLGTNVEAAMALLELLDGHPHVPVVRLRSRYSALAYTWADHSNAWQQLASLLTKNDLALFQSVVLGVLPQRQPEDHQWFSDWLLEGLTRSLALLGNSGDNFDRPSNTLRRGREWAEEIVQQLLTPDAARWGTLSGSLPLLAEAAPQKFLVVLSQSLRLDVKGVGALFATPGASGNPHGVLWALETLAWDIELVREVALSLAALVEFDNAPEHASHPRALGCLAATLGYALPQTNASAEQRLNILTEIARTRPTVGRRLLLSLLPSGLGVLRSPARRPKYLSISLPSEHVPVQANEAYGQIKTYLELLVDIAGVSAEHWAELFSAVHIPDSLVCILLDRLSNSIRQIDDPNALIWTQLRSTLHWMRGAGKPARSRPSFQKRLARTQEIYRLIEPNDPVMRISWLFATRPIFAERFQDFRTEAVHIETERQNALAWLWQCEDRWFHLERLVRLAEPPKQSESPRPTVIASWLALELTKSEWAEPLEKQLLMGPSFAPFGLIAPQFLSRRLIRRSFSETETILRRLVGERRFEEALALARMIPEPGSDREVPLWQLLDDLGGPLVANYWRSIQDLWTRDRPLSQQEFAVRRLLTFGNLRLALRLVSHGEPSVPSGLLLDVLERVEGELPDVDPHEVTEALSRLDGDASVDIARARSLELTFLDLLFHVQHSPSFLVSEFVKNPGWVAQLAVTDEGKRTLLQITELWHGYPGDDRPVSERSIVLQDWCRALLVSNAQKDYVLSLIGLMLARPESDTRDGIWPCLATRRFLDKFIVDPDERRQLARDILAAKFNMRCATSRAVGEGGAQEYDLAEQYRHSAEHLRLPWPHTAELLEDIARQYDWEAREHDADAHVDRWRYHLPQRDDTMTPPSVKPLFPLTRMLVENFRHMEKLDVTFDRQLCVFIGPNASGKTTVLDAVAIGLAEVQDQIFGSKIVAQLLVDHRDRRITWTSPSDFKQEPDLSLQFWGQATDASSLETLRWGLAPRPSALRRRRGGSEDENEALRTYLRPAAEVLLTNTSGSSPVPVFAYYGVKRAVASEVQTKEPEPVENDPDAAFRLGRTGGFDGALNAAAGYQLLVRWWRSKQTEEDELKKERQDFSARLAALEAVREVVEKAVRTSPQGGMRCWNPRAKAGRFGLVVDFDRGDGSAVEMLDLSQLSDGFRTHLALVMDLARRMIQANPPPDGDIQRDGWGTRSHAVVLIDEVDLHLHPSWQRSVLGSLLDAFPNTQFIVTTHSPQVIASVETQHVFRLGKGPSPSHPAHTKGMDTNTILTSVMGDRHRDANAQAQIDALANLIDAGRFNVARAELSRLETQFGNTDPELIRLGGLLRFLEPNSEINDSQE